MFVEKSEKFGFSRNPIQIGRILLIFDGFLDKIALKSALEHFIFPETSFLEVIFAVESVSDSFKALRRS